MTFLGTIYEVVETVIIRVESKCMGSFQLDLPSEILLLFLLGSF